MVRICAWRRGRSGGGQGEDGWSGGRLIPGRLANADGHTTCFTRRNLDDNPGNIISKAARAATSRRGRGGKRSPLLGWDRAGKEVFILSSGKKFRRGATPEPERGRKFCENGGASRSETLLPRRRDARFVSRVRVVAAGFVLLFARCSSSKVCQRVAGCFGVRR